MKSALEHIEKILKSSHSLPFLFVGSGISLRYQSSVNWVGLLRHFADIIDPSDLVYEKYETKATQELITQGQEISKNVLLTKVADMIERDFNALWFELPQFEESRKKYRDYVRSRITPFKIEVANFFAQQLNPDMIPTEYSREIELLKNMGSKSISGLISTNYDLFLEYLFPKHNVYIGQENLIFSNTFGVNEIYKIHGCCTKPNSIIINSRDYADFDKKNAYLAAKLMTIFVEHPIIFLGYSLDDENIQSIIKAIVDCLSEENLVVLRDRLIFVEWNKEYKTIDAFPYSRDFGGGKVVNMTKVTTSSYEPVFDLLSKNKAKYPTKFLRNLKQDIYNLALTSETSDKMFVNMPSNEEDLNSEDVEVVIGFGVLEYGKQGYKGVPAEKVFHDILFNSQNFNIKLMVEDALPTLLKRVANSLPVFKYISQYEGNLPSCFDKFADLTYESFITQTNRKDRARFKFSSIKEAIEHGGGELHKELRNLQALEEKNINMNELGEYLRGLLTKQPDFLYTDNSFLKTSVRKLIKIYDYLKYKRGRT